MSWGRVRLPFVGAVVLVLLVSSFLNGFVPGWVRLTVLGIALALYFRLGSPPARQAVEVQAPVVGRWRALNSPADRTPSHGLHAYGQTFAIDLVCEPDGATRPASGGMWPLARRPDDYPAFG